MSNKPFVPAFGGKPLVPGCSDKTPRSLYLAEQERPGAAVKLTTASRASAALEQYWQQQHTVVTTTSSSQGSTGAAGKHLSGAGQHSRQDHLPGGERELAHKTRNACWRDSVRLDHQLGPNISDSLGTPKDIEEKEKTRTRGIPGYTGCQPPLGGSKPPELPAPVEASRWTAINAFDERRPRIKGIPGYTGHQPHAPAAAAGSGSPGPASAASSLLHNSSPPTHAQTSTDASAASAASGLYSQLRQNQAGFAAHWPHDHPHPSANTAAEAHSSGVTCTASAAELQHGSPAGHYHARAAEAAFGVRYPSVAGSAAVSRISSPPRYFCDGLEVPAAQVPAPPQSAAAMGSYCMTAGVPHAHAASNISSMGGLSHSSSSPGGAGPSQSAEVLLVSQGCTTASPAGTAWTSNGSSVPASHVSSSRGDAASAHPGLIPARTGRPAVGPWCTTYSSTFVQQEVYRRLMEQFKAAALHKQQQKQQLHK